MNCGIGDNILIRKVDSSIPILDSSRVELYPLAAPDNTTQSSDTVKELFLQQSLVGQYISKGHVVSISYHGRFLKFCVCRIEMHALSSTPLSTAPESPENIADSVFNVSLNTKIAIVARPKNEVADSDSKKAAKSEINFKLVGGLKSQIEELKELVELPLKNPGLFRKYGVKPPRGVLLYGPPGTGKTLLAKVLASVTGAKCFTLSAPEIMSKYYGESESKLRDLFLEAEAASPALIFIDEIDAIAPKRDTSESEVSKRIVGTLLTLMDGMDSSSTASSSSSASSGSKSSGKPKEPPRVVVLAATNRPNSLDPALRRPGRFDREIEIPIPNEAGRLDILRVYFNQMQHKLSEEQIIKVAATTHGYVGADLHTLCKESALCAFKRAYHSPQKLSTMLATPPPSETSEGLTDAAGLTKEAENELSVIFEDVMHAMAEIRPSAMREIMVDIPKVKWEDIGGYEEVKEKLKQAVEWPLKVRF